MNTILLLLALQFAAGTSPDYAQLAPALVKASEASFGSDTEEHVAINFGSFVSEMKRAGISVSGQQLRQALDLHGRSYENRSRAVSCEERPCSWALGSVRLYVQLNTLSMTEAGVQAEVAIQARVQSQNEDFVTNVIVYDMVWENDGWTTTNERVKLRS